jgi:BirA family biotin operon repressor/biotin-[acetyl-CoA-carboxylase] ligase
MTGFGQPRRHFSKCGSTNDLAREWAKDESDPAPSGALVTADFQTRGRGQRGHQWQAQDSQGALMSFVYRLPPVLEAGQLGLVTALAAAEALAFLGVAPQIKWPNDLLLNESKVGGILVEVSAGVAVLGIGINVGQTEFEGAAGFAYPPTSLRLASGREQPVESVIEAVTQSLALWRERWQRDGFPVVLERCREVLAVGASVRQGEVSGVLIGLSESGAALVQLADGTFAEWATVN